MSYPRCFASQTAYDAWAYYADRSNVSPLWPCIDCTVAYQQRMVAARRCQHPEAIPGKSRPCPAPSAAAKPEVTSGKTLPTGHAHGQRSSAAARGAAKSSTTNAGNASATPPAGARSSP